MTAGNTGTDNLGYTQKMIRELIRSWHSSKALLALLAGTLLFAQAAVVTHELEPELLDSDHACETCLAASVLGSANLAATPADLFIPHDKWIEPAPARSLVTILVAAPKARGPPATS